MSSKNNNNKLNIPEAREAMNQFKMEAANEHGAFISAQTQVEVF